MARKRRHTASGHASGTPIQIFFGCTTTTVTASGHSQAAGRGLIYNGHPSGHHGTEGEAAATQTERERNLQSQIIEKNAHIIDLKETIAELRKRLRDTATGWSEPPPPGAAPTPPPGIRSLTVNTQRKTIELKDVIPNEIIAELHGLHATPVNTL